MRKTGLALLARVTAFAIVGLASGCERDEATERPSNEDSFAAPVRGGRMTMVRTGDALLVTVTVNGSADADDRARGDSSDGQPDFVRMTAEVEAGNLLPAYWLAQPTGELLPEGLARLADAERASPSAARRVLVIVLPPPEPAPPVRDVTASRRPGQSGCLFTSCAVVPTAQVR